MANKYAQSTGNWSAGGGGGIWYDAASGGSVVAKPAAGDVAYICDGANVTIDENVSCSQILNVGNTGYITVTDNRTMTLTGSPGISSTTTSTSGFVRVSANTLTITHDQGAGTIAVQQATGAGYAIALSSTGACSVSNSGGTAIYATSGNGVNHSSSGNLAITGVVSASGAYAIRTGGAGTCTINGNISNVSTGSATNAVFLNSANFILTLNGLPLVSATAYGNLAVGVNNGKLIWVGNQTLAAGENASVATISANGTIELSNATSYLNLTCSGKCLIQSPAGTLTATGGAAGDATIVLQNDEASAAILGNKTTSIITMLNLSAGNVKKDVVIHGVTGTYEGAGGGGGGAKIIGG